MVIFIALFSVGIVFVLVGLILIGVGTRDLLDRKSAQDASSARIEIRNVITANGRGAVLLAVGLILCYLGYAGLRSLSDYALAGASGPTATRSAVTPSPTTSSSRTPSVTPSAPAPRPTPTRTPRPTSAHAPYDCPSPAFRPPSGSALQYTIDGCSCATGVLYPGVRLRNVSAYTLDWMVTGFPPGLSPQPPSGTLPSFSTNQANEIYLVDGPPPSSDPVGMTIAWGNDGVLSVSVPSCNELEH